MYHSIKVANREDVEYVARRMRPHDRAERLALTHGDDPVAAATRFLDYPGFAVTVWKGTPIAVIGAIFGHPGVASTVFFATDQFHHVALATTRYVRRTLIPALLGAGAHRLQVCSMDDPANLGSQRWIESFGARQEAFLYQYGRNGEDFRIFTLSKEGMKRVTSVEN